MSSVTFIPHEPSGHLAVPAKDTWVTERGAPASLLTGPYPVTARCQVCGGPIRLETRLQMEWRHAPAGAPS